MSVYAVVDPATGEAVKEYPTISDEELRDAIAQGGQGSSQLVQRDHGGGAGGSGSAGG